MFGSIFQTFQLGIKVSFTTSCEYQSRLVLVTAVLQLFLDPSDMAHWVRSADIRTVAKTNKWFALDQWKPWTKVENVNRRRLVDRVFLVETKLTFKTGPEEKYQQRLPRQASLAPVQPQRWTVNWFLAITKGTPIDNGVVGIPKIECGSDSISVNVSTRNPFLGRIFVKDKSQVPGCTKRFQKTALFTKLSPMPSLEENIVVIISFHYLFITKVDKAYSIQCTYGAQSMATVLFNFNVSMIPTESLSFGAGPTPECSYEIRKGSINGPLVQYAEVGDQLYHRWMCFGEVKILVRNCYVTDGNAEKFLVIDSRGCAIDYNVLGDLKYDTNGQSAWVESHAFKFADTTSVAFACAIKVCMPSTGNCAETTPPQCTVYPSSTSHVHTRQRDVPLLANADDEIDVSAPSFNVLDQKLNQPPSSSPSEDTTRPNESQGLVSENNEKKSNRVSSTEICLSKIFVVALVVAVLGTLIPLIVGIAALFTVIRQKGYNYRIYT